MDDLGKHTLKEVDYFWMFFPDLLKMSLTMLGMAKPGMSDLP